MKQWQDTFKEGLNEYLLKQVNKALQSGDQFALAGALDELSAFHKACEGLAKQHAENVRVVLAFGVVPVDMGGV